LKKLEKKLIKKLKELHQNINQQNIRLKDYIDFNEIFEDVEKKE